MQIAISDVAEQVGLSSARLRALASSSLGMSLSVWRRWTALTRALGALAEGSSIPDAAYAAGFSDQAHLTRVMRSTLGLSPGRIRDVAAKRSIQDARQPLPQ